MTLGYAVEVAPTLEQQLVLWLLTADPQTELTPSFLEPINWTRWLEFAQQEIRAFLHHVIRSRHLEPHFPSDVLGLLRNAHDAGAMLHLRRAAELRRIALALQTYRIPFLALKGMALAEAVYPAPALRFMTDMDLLVPPQHEAAALQIAMDLGYRYADRHLFAMNLAGETVTLHLPGTHQLLEIHPRIATAPSNSDMQRLFDRSVPIQIAGSAINTLHPEDFLLHLAVHATERHQLENGLLALLDVAQLLRTWKDSLSGLPGLAARTGFTKSFQLVCSIAASMLKVQLPSDWVFVDYPEQEELTRIAVAQVWYGSHREVPQGVAVLLSQSSVSSLLRAIRQRMSLVNVVGATKRIYASFRRGDLSRRQVADGVHFQKRRERMRVLLGTK